MDAGEPNGHVEVENTIEDMPHESGDGVVRSDDAKTAAARLTGQLLSNPNVLAAFQEKLGGMVGKSSGYIESLPKSVKRRLKALKRLQSQMFNIEAKFYEEVHKLECQYASLYAPLYEKREAVINARVEPTDSECEWSSEEEEDEDGGKAKITEINESKPSSEQNGKETDTDLDEKMSGVPEFWLTIFKNVDVLASLVQENDEPILRSLLDIRVKFSTAETMGFTLEFVFAPNDYFTNSVLTKEYIMKSEPDADNPLHYEGPEIVRCKGCEINWKADKNVTVRKRKEKVKGSKKMITKTVKVESFFNFFSPPEVKEDDEDDVARELLLADHEVGQLLQDRIIPRAVLYFTGDALDDDNEDDYDQDGEEGEEEEGEDKDNSDEDADKDYVPPKGTKGGPADCKQQ